MLDSWAETSHNRTAVTVMQKGIVKGLSKKTIQSVSSFAEPVQQRVLPQHWFEIYHSDISNFPARYSADKMLLANFGYWRRCCK